MNITNVVKLSYFSLIALPGTVVYYTIYDVMKEKLGFDMHATGDAAKKQLWIPPVVGALARFTAVYILSPMELARTKMQVSDVSSQPMSAVFIIHVK